MSFMKQFFKRNHFIMNVYQKGIDILIKISPYLATKYLYKKNTGKKLDLKNPKDFNEKIQWLKLYWQHPLVPKCGDKYELRNYAKEVGCSDVLNESYGVFDDALAIDWDVLPEKFVLKVTSGCGFNMICKDKKKLDKEEAVKKLNQWLQVDYGLERAELHYSKMTPRILCEKFIETNDGKLPIDYKIFCFNGMPKLILVALDRATDMKRVFFDLKWNQIEFGKEKVSLETETIKKPQSLSEMVLYAEKLASPFPFVRVDFYDDNGKAVLGEMTFTPNRGMATHYHETMLHQLGEMIKLPEKIS